MRPLSRTPAYHHNFVDAIEREKVPHQVEVAALPRLGKLDSVLSRNDTFAPPPPITPPPSPHGRHTRHEAFTSRTGSAPPLAVPADLLCPQVHNRGKLLLAGAFERLDFVRHLAQLCADGGRHRRPHLVSAEARHASSVTRRRTYWSSSGLERDGAGCLQRPTRAPARLTSFAGRSLQCCQRGGPSWVGSGGLASRTPAGPPPKLPAASRRRTAARRFFLLMIMSSVRMRLRSASSR